MGRRWLHSVDLETDAQNRPLAEKALIAAEAAVGGTINAGAVANVLVGATTTVVLAADAARHTVVLTNLSDERIDVAVGTDAEADKGIPLAANGGAVSLTAGRARLAINAICASGSKTLAVQTFSAE